MNNFSSNPCKIKTNKGCFIIDLISLVFYYSVIINQIILLTLFIKNDELDKFLVILIIITIASVLRAITSYYNFLNENLFTLKSLLFIIASFLQLDFLIIW
jgi:hypothetical protein